MTIALPEHEARARHEQLKQEMLVKQLRLNAALNVLGHLARTDFEGAFHEAAMQESGKLGEDFKPHGINPEVIAQAAIAYGDQVLLMLGIIGPSPEKEQGGVQIIQ